jgi:hypothetical protein
VGGGGGDRLHRVDAPAALHGQRATTWEDEQGYTHDVVVVYPDSVRTSAGDVANIVVPQHQRDPGTAASR